MLILKISKVSTLLIGIIMMAILLCCSSQVQAAQDGDYTYTVTAGKAQITAYIGAGGVVSIPSTFDGFPVTSIGDGAFKACDGLTTIRFNSATTRIYDSADTIPIKAKIIGYAPSTAKTYATKYNRKFEVIGTTDVTVTGVRIKTISSSEIDLSWNALKGAKSYTIYQATSENGTYAKVGSVKTTRFKNIKLQPSTSYWYKITAVNAGGESNFSMIQTATTLPLAPSGVKATLVSSTTITLKWDGVVGKTFNVYRSTSQKGKYTKIAEGLNECVYNDMTLTPGTIYWYKVTVLNHDGNESAASTLVSAVTKSVGPSKLKAKVISKNEIDLSWDKVKGAKLYIVYSAANGDGLYSKVGTPKTASFKNIGLQSGISYWYKVTVVTSTGEGDYSEAVMATTLSDSDSDSDSEDIIIGGNLELTGSLSAFGQTAKNVIELAFQQFNDQGGILNGRKLKFITEDNKSGYNEVATAATKLIKQDKVVGIIGPLTSGGTTAEIPVATENRVPVITPSGSAPDLTVNENGQLNQWIFRACFIDPVEGRAAAQFALGNKITAKTAAVIIDQNDGYSQALATAFVQSFTNGGGQIIDQEQFVASSNNFSTILANISNTNPDIVYLPCYYQMAGEIVKQARDLGMNMPFIGGAGWANAEIYNIGGVQAMNNTYYTDHIALDDSAMAQFITDYQAKYGEKPNAFVDMDALAFDTAKMYFRAIEIAGSTDTEKIRRALENIKDLQGLSGNITVDPTTHNPIKNVFVMENKEGKAVFVTKIGPN